MNTYNKVLFVCRENTCRSPMAASIMHHFLLERNITDVVVGSKGMVVLFQEPYNPKAVAVGASFNIIIPSNCSSQLDNSDFDTDTLVLTMDEDIKQKIYETYDKAINVYTLYEYIGETDGEIADPYGRGMDEYKKVFGQLYGLVEKAADKLYEACSLPEHGKK